MQFETNRRRSNLTHRLIVAVFAIMFLPMAPWVSDGLRAAGEKPRSGAKPGELAVEKAKLDNIKETEETTPYPQIVESTPAAGSTDIDPKLTEISVTFDRDMSEGMSWTGGGDEFPGDPSRKATWIDKRTCVLPVKLKKAAYFRIGINSESYQNFKAADGTATPPNAIFFTTKGADRELENRVRIPEIVEVSLGNDEEEVPTSTKEIRVTFNMPMGDGMSWTGGGEAFPSLPDGKKPKWSKDGRTCSLPVVLKPNHEYKLGFNSLSHNNFQSKWGVPLKPVVYNFKTGS